jgi:demethylmenaquinone methyltransferase/2-methoxy-6-polyprenyl-1,4-benzoquinol methylase
LKALKTNDKSYEIVASQYAEFNYHAEREAIIKSKMAELKEITPGKKVLFAGSGPGEDSLAAARIGAEITCIDLSSRMLSIAAQKFKEQNAHARFLQMDVMEHHEMYDVVIANFFLNIFDRKTTQLVLRHLASLVKPGGTLMIADLAPLEGSLLNRIFHYIMFFPFNALFALLGICAWHIPYEYGDYFADCGLKPKWQEYFRDWKFGPMLYKTWVATKI